MALAMQQSLDIFPGERVVFMQLSHQSWWRDGITMVSKSYLADWTWELVVTYQGKRYAVTYDTLDGRCDAIDPIDYD
jgi:hypothetical protein